MIKRVMTRADVIDELSERTSLFKKYVDAILVELESIVFENMKLAELDNPSEVKIFKSIGKLGAKRIPEKMVCNAREHTKQLAPERNRPYAQFSKTLRDRISPKNGDDNESESE